MSTNIHFSATREIIVVKTGKRDTQQISFNEWQTPSEVTRQIMASPDREQAYKDWILRECSEDQEMYVFAEDDIFCERDPVGKEFFNPGKEHIAAFDEWLQMCEEEGYTVTAEAW